MKKKIKTTLPQSITVTIENEGEEDGEFFQVNMSVDAAAEQGVKKRAARYVLVETFSIESVAKVVVSPT